MISLGEVFLSPTSMVYRNLMAMAVEEMIRAQPMDAVVLMGGCDKTVPALLMGAVSAGKPAVMLVAGPMMTGRYKESVWVPVQIAVVSGLNIVLGPSLQRKLIRLREIWQSRRELVR